LKKSLSLLGGVAVLAVAAVPAVGQSSGKVAPASVSATTTPGRDTTAPYTFITKGKVKKPKATCPAGTTDTTYCTPALTNAQACKGKVRVRIRRASDNAIIKSKKVAVGSKCGYKATQTLNTSDIVGSKVKLRVEVRFLGNSVLTAKSATTKTVYAN
jgi:hypothetical protein